MSTAGERMTILSEDECWHLLASMALGRLVTCVKGRPERYFRLTSFVQRRTVLFRIAERATKLFTVVMNNQVAFEADDHNVAEGWSVIVKGQGQVLNNSAEIQEAERAHLLPWTAGAKRRYVRVSQSEISGRRFRFGSQPDQD